MSITAIFAFIKALPEMVQVLGEIAATLKQMKQDKIDEELAKIQNEVDTHIQILEGARSDEERKKALLALKLATRR